MLRAVNGSKFRKKLFFRKALIFLEKVLWVSEGACPIFKACFDWEVGGGVHGRDWDWGWGWGCCWG